MIQSRKDDNKELNFDLQQEFLKSQNKLYMKGNGRVNDYIQSILKVLHEFELKD